MILNLDDQTRSLAFGALSVHRPIRSNPCNNLSLMALGVAALDRHFSQTTLSEEQS
jgi:hypothetical protein